MSSPVKPPPLRALLRFTLGRVSWPLFLLPPAFLIALSLYARWGTWVPDKRAAEFWALELIYAALAVALVQYWRRREAYWLWLTLLTAAFLFREYHFHNTSVGAFFVILGLLLYAWRHYLRFAAYFASKATVSLLAATLLSYALAVACDKGYLDFLSGSFPVQSRIEEYLENLGHILLLLLTLGSRQAENPLTRTPA